ncbi:peptidase M24 family protein, partial [Streptomyces sp. SID8111]|uniref:aminopeptidase P family N-terminal domain-containing protein n=1 Tax=Streptomyces sp. SID8111 TaxID=2706100 RepID=UPI0013BFF0F9
MSEVYAARRARLRECCNAGGSAAALVSRPANVRYLAGAAPEGAVLLLGPAEDLLVCGSPPDDRAPHARPDEALRRHV